MTSSKKTETPSTVAVIGLGYVGLPLAADSKPFGFMPFRNRKNTVPL